MNGGPHSPAVHATACSAGCCLACPLSTSPALHMRPLPTLTLPLPAQAALPLRMLPNTCRPRSGSCWAPAAAWRTGAARQGGPHPSLGSGAGGLGQPALAFVLQQCAARVRVLLTVCPATWCNLSLCCLGSGLTLLYSLCCRPVLQDQQLSALVHRERSCSRVPCCRPAILCCICEAQSPLLPLPAARCLAASAVFHFTPPITTHLTVPQPLRCNCKLSTDAWRPHDGDGGSPGGEWMASLPLDSRHGSTRLQPSASAASAVTHCWIGARD